MYDVCVTTGPEAHPPQPANTVAVSPGPLLIENTGRVSTVTIYSTCNMSVTTHCTMAGLYFKGTAHGCIEPIALKVM